MTCSVCGHRLSLHGKPPHEVWCIAWNGSMEKFCGCQTYVAVPADGPSGDELR